MTKDTLSQDKPQQEPVNPVKNESVQYSHYFICLCGCGSVSDPLLKDYIRLRKNQHWVAKGCEGDREIVKEFKNGFIVKESDF